MAAGLRTGYASKLYRNTATWATPTWDEITAAQDVRVGLVMNFAEIKARLSAYVQHLTTLKQADIEFGMLADTSIADYNVIRDAQIAGTLVGLALADDAIATSGTDHWRGEYYFGDFDYTQGLEEGNVVKVTAKLAYSSNVPIWTDVA
jgi:hypothetical protein